jgi:hypothetical protein
MAVVFRKLTYSPVLVHNRCCSSCSVGSWDGSELLVLRKASVRSKAWPKLFGTPDGSAVELCFHWDMLRSNLVAIGNGSNVYREWVSTVQMYENSNDLCPVKSSMITGLYKHLNEEFMEFVDLQHIDYSEVLRCRCDCQFENLVAEGITISCPRSKLNVVSPIEPELNEYSDIVFGSSFEERTLIPNKKDRKLLYSFVHAYEGVQREDCIRLNQSSLNDDLKVLLREHNSAVCVSNGRLKCADWARGLMHEIASATPACAIVQTSQIVLEAWVQQMQQFIASGRAQRFAREQLFETIPVLCTAINKAHELLVSSNAGGLTDEVSSTRREVDTALVRLLAWIVQVGLHSR